MLLTWVLGGVAVGAVIYAIHTRRDLIEAREEYGKRCVELSDALGEVGRLKLKTEAQSTDIRDYKKLLAYGCRNLKIRESHHPVVTSHPTGVVSVVGEDERDSSFFFLIKAFSFDWYDPEDRDFAIREAEELIEIINKF